MKQGKVCKIPCMVYLELDVYNEVEKRRGDMIPRARYISHLVKKALEMKED